jgi:NitT/TauT family transport system substrate-binding protein
MAAVTPGASRRQWSSQMLRTITKISLGLILGVGFSIAHAHAQSLHKLKVAEVVRSQLFAPMYVAMSEGFMKDQGIDIELVTANGGDRVGALVISGQVDVGLAGPEVAIYIYNSESPDKPVMFCSVNGTDGFFFVSREKLDSFDWTSLRNRKIIGWRPGSTPQLFFEYVLKQNGVDAEAIKSIITNIPPPAREGAWMSGSGEFGIFNEPSTSNLARAGQVHVLASIGRELGRAENTVFFAKKSWYEKNREAAQKLTNAIAKAQVWMKAASDERIASAIAPFFPGVPMEISVTVMKRYRETGAPIWSESTVIDRAGLAKLQEIMAIGGVIAPERVVAYEAIVASDVALEAQRTVPPR